jgi:hypothetical protein
MMTWREFDTLIRGLGPNSITSIMLRARGRDGADEAPTITDPRAIENALGSILGR